jgi:hypothetical protein
MLNVKGAQFAKNLILTCGRWYVAYPLSDQQVEERRPERGVVVDHSTIHRWVLQYAPQLEEAFHRRKRPVTGISIARVTRRDPRRDIQTAHVSISRTVACIGKSMCSGGIPSPQSSACWPKPGRRKPKVTTYRPMTNGKRQRAKPTKKQRKSRRTTGRRGVGTSRPPHAE